MANNISIDADFVINEQPDIQADLHINFIPDISNLVTREELAEDLADKQDALTAGANITIDNNVISATDTIYTAGEGISIVDNVISNTQTSAEWGNIEGDISDQTDLIDLIDTKIDIEATARENNDLSLQNGINTLNDDLTAEISNRGTADGILQGNIDTLSGTVTSNYNTLDGKIGDNKTAIDNHIADKTNPHEVTKAQVGLGNCDNTSDLNKPISTATQNALNGKANTSDLSTVATTGDYDDLSNKPTIPTVNDATLTIQKNGSNVATFTANSSTNQTANITVPTQASDIGALPDTTTINDLTTAEQQSALNSGATSTNIGQIATNTQNISNEVTNRQNADNALQSQIDALVVASDVFDIVGTYAELQAYDISTVPVNDIIKVLVDSTHDNAATYYRCVENDNVKSWSYIGAEGAYYTKSEADGRFVEQTTTVNGQALSNNITLDAEDVGALPDSTTIGNGTLTIQKNGSTIDSFGANDTGNTTVNITVPTDTGDLTNNAGYIKGINGTDVTTALGYTPYDSSNPDGYTTNVGTVTSVNNTQPDANGNVTISIPTQVQANWNETDTSSKAYIQNKPNLSTVATTGDYDDLTNKPTIPAAQVNSDWNASSGVAQILNKPTLSTVATTGDYDDLTNKPTIPAAQVQSNWNETDTTSKAYIQNKPSLSTVATSGNYNDLSNKPTIPTVNDATLTIQKNGTTVQTFTANASSNVTCNITVPTNTNELTNGAGFITGISSSDVTTALGYTPYDSSNPNGYTSNVGTVTKVNNTSPDANGNVTLSIPSVGNGTITITQGGTTKGTFTTNQSENSTIDLDAGGGSSTDVQINGTSITSNNVANIVTNSAYNASSNKLATMSDVPSDYLTNTATGSGSLTIEGTASSNSAATNIGDSSEATANNSIALGYKAQATANFATAIGRTSKASGVCGIQIGYGTNSTANTLSIGFYNNSSTHYNWQLLDGTTGLIPTARIDTDTTATSGSAKPITSGAVYTIVGNIESALNTINSGSST